MGHGSSTCCEESQTNASETVQAERVEQHTVEPDSDISNIRLDSRNPMRFSQKARWKEHRFLEVDKDMVRGILLGSSLKRLGHLWRTSPLDLPSTERGELWKMSKAVERFDIFFSHTWETRGSWKVISLLLHFGWHFILLCWLALTATGVAFSSALPMPCHIERHVLSFHSAEIPFFPWILIFSAMGILLGFLAAPYLMDFGRPKTCFLDVTSIHQTDEVSMERGVYGLGGFLSISGKLHVLWSPPYLSRLWCVFEIAAFRRAQPTGLIQMTPLFLASQVLFFTMGGIFASSIESLSTCLGVGLQFNLPATMVTTLPVVVLCHMNRKSMYKKHCLISELSNFKLNAAKCRVDTDRDFILDAIRDWYGSEDAFEDYVRGPLRDELLNVSFTNLPLSCGLIIITGPVASLLDFLMASVWAGAPVESILSELIASIGTYVFQVLVQLKVLWVLCDLWASPRDTVSADILTSVGIYLVFLVSSVALIYVSTLIFENSLFGSIAWAVVNLLLVLLAYSKQPAARRA